MVNIYKVVLLVAFNKSQTGLLTVCNKQRFWQR